MDDEQEKPTSKPKDWLFPYDLSVEIATEKVDDNLSIIDVGNTGVGFDVCRGDRDYLQQYFMPDGATTHTEEPSKKLKNSILYAGGMYEFLQYFKENEDQIPSNVEGHTNQEMLDFRRKLFGEHFKVGSSFTTERGKTEINYNFDLNEILEDSELMQRLEKYNHRMKTQDYKMKFSVQKNG